MSRRLKEPKQGMNVGPLRGGMPFHVEVVGSSYIYRGSNMISGVLVHCAHTIVSVLLTLGLELLKWNPRLRTGESR